MKPIRPTDIPLYRDDLRTGAAAIPGQSGLAGKSLLITGATGLIGSAVTDMLGYIHRTERAGLSVYLAVRDRDKAVRRFGEHDFLHFLPYDAEKEISFDVPADYIIHGAGNAYPKAISQYPVETMTANLWGIRNLLDYARNHGARRTLFISSSEIYGVRQSGSPFREGEYGTIDPLNPRSCYAISKKAAETLCVSFGAEYGLDAVIVRPGHIYGPTSSPQDNRVSSAFARAAADGLPLVMKSAGTQRRSYCYCVDCAAAILTVLTSGKPLEAYNISHPRSVVTIRQMAEITARAGGVELKYELPDDKEKSAFNPMDNSSLCSEKLEALGWRGRFDADEGLAHTVEILKAMKEGGFRYAGATEATGV